MLPVYENVLVLAAHPDDETLGCGATIKKLSLLGSKIRLIVFTDGVSSRGHSSSSPRNDRQTLDKVSDILGIHSYCTGNFPDNKMDTVSALDLCKFVENNVDFNPDLILTHDSSCLNVDHRAVNNASLTVFRPQHGFKHRIMTYYIPSSTDYNFNSKFNSNTYVDVGGTYGDKLRCLEDCYAEEMRPWPHSRSIKNVKALMSTWGSEVGIRYAEKFNQLVSIE